MVEKLQADSEKSLEVHKDEVIKALAGEAGDPSASSPDDNPLVTEAMTHAVGGSVFAVAMAVREDLSATNKNNTNSMFVGGGPKSKTNSLFVGGGGGKATHTSTPLVPVDRKAVKGSDLVSRAGISSMSLTGSSSSGGKPTPIKGASISDKIAKMLRIADLKQELGVVNQEMGKSLDEGSKRTMEALKKGDDRARRAVQRSSKNTTPQTQQSPTPSGQKS